MKASVVLILFLFAIAAAPLNAADGAAAERFPLLNRLTPPDATLPRGCSVAKGSSPVEGLTNRLITTNPGLIMFMDGPLTEAVGTNIEAMYYGVYREKAEIGVFGWAFKSQETAKQARDKLVEKYPDRF